MTCYQWMDLHTVVMQALLSAVHCAVSTAVISADPGPPAQEVTSEMQITWASDHSITKSGWEICIVFPEESWLK